jgi:copper(I)-binding protein
MKTPFLTTALAALAMLTSSAQAQTAPKVEAAWARPTVAGQGAGGGFLKITGGATADKLLSARADVSKSVELHTMEMDGNVMRMRQVPAIDVPAGGTVELKPGGRHVMFMGLTQPLKAGTRFPLTLRFEKAGEVKVDVEIAAQAPGGAAPMAEHKH